jgi:hypothetical protein
MRTRTFLLIGLVFFLGCSTQTVAANTGSTGGTGTGTGTGSTGNTGTGNPSASGSTAPATPTTTSDLPGNDSTCTDTDGKCSAEALCAAWAWSDTYIQEAVSASDFTIDLRLQAGSDNPESTNSRAGQADSPYNAMTEDAGDAVADNPSYQILLDKVNDIDNDINNTNPGDQYQQSLQKVAADSEKLGSLCTSQHLLQPASQSGT